MTTEPLTQDAGTYFARAGAPRAFLVIHIESDTTSRVVDLPRETDVTFGRSRGATISVETEKVSRMHARIRRTIDGVEIEDLGSRNGTRVNGERIEGVRRLSNGDEISIGPIQAIINLTSGLFQKSAVVDTLTGEARLAAEVDRSVRYRRP